VYTANALPLLGKGSADDLRNSRINRLRLVAFPEFATTTYTQGDLSALVPIEAVMTGLNVSASKLKQISVKVPAAESYGISVGTIIDKIAEQIDRTKIWKLSDGLLPAAALQCSSALSSEGAPGKKLIYLRVLTEVFYARAMDITLFSSGSFGVRGSGSVPVPGGDSRGKVTLPTPDSAGTPDMVKDIQARLANTHTVPGGSVQVLSYNDQTIGLRRCFDRPVAIGFRALVLAVDEDGIIQNVSVDGGGPSQLVNPNSRDETQ
jgi:hypothetical protein